MREGAKKRLIGAVVVVALAVIFVPMLFEPEPLDRLPPVTQTIPRPPAFNPGVKTETFLGPQDSGVGGGDAAAPKVSQPLALPPPPEGAAAPAGRPEASGTAAAATPPRAVASAPAKPPAAEPATAKPAKGAAAPEAAPPRGANGGSSWVIQVLSVPNAAGATDWEKKLKASGFSAFVEKAEVNGKTTYRVKVGPEADRARADQTVARLREKHKVEPLIQKYP